MKITVKSKQEKKQLIDASKHLSDFYSVLALRHNKFMYDPYKHKHIDELITLHTNPDLIEISEK